MSSPRSGRSFLRCEQLEARENPSGPPLVTDSFDAIGTPYLPPGDWRMTATNGEEYYGVGRTALSGSQSMAVYGTVGVDSFAWTTAAVPADTVVSAAVRTPVPAPIFVYARGRNLGTASASYLAAAVTPGGAVELREVLGGTARVVRSVTVPAGTAGWLRITLTTLRDTAAVQVRRADTGEYLTPGGTWQVGEATAINGGGLASASGQSGIGRLSGPYGTAFVDDFSAAGAQALEIPRKYSHIRIAQLAYSGTPIDDFTRNLFRDSVDLTVTNPALMPALDAAAPDTPQLVYSNVSNLYQGLLTDWLGFADRTGADREAAFFHVAQPTPFQGGSPSSQPVTWFWGVYRGPQRGAKLTTDLTANARGTRPTGVTFGPTGEVLSIGFPDRFREVNVTLTRPANLGWNAAWEYVAEVDAQGVPTAWKRLSLASDGTAGLRLNGKLVFEPPADWKAAKLPGGTDARLFYVRARTVTGTADQAPIAATVLGRDYVGANGQPQGTIPAFDYAVDLDGNGYLTDGEYAQRKAGFDARFVHEGRLFYPFYGQMRFAVNPAQQAVKDWAGDFHVRQLAQTPLADGVFLDNSNGKPPLNGAVVREPVGATFSQEAGALVAAVGAAIAPKFVAANTAGAAAEADPVAAASAAAFEEFLLRPMQATWSQVGDAANIVNRRLNAASPSPYVVIDTHPAGGSATDPRTQVATLAYYYLLGDPEKTFLMFFGGNGPSAPWSQRWVPAAAVDVGKPTGGMTTFATGVDPQNAQLTYKVFARGYQNALVLYKPRSYTLGKGTGTTADATATTHQLGGSYRRVNADGTMGPGITSITLRNAEGAVLMKA